MSTGTLIKREAITETYFDVENLIRHTAYSFYRLCGGDYQEMIAEANTAYMKAYESHDPNKSAFNTWLRNTIWRHLIDYFIRGKQKRLQTVGINAEEVFASRPGRPFCELLSELSKDSRTIVSLILELPEEVQTVAIKKGGQSKNIRHALREYLQHSLGWTYRRTAECFQEISEVVNE